MGTWPLVNGMFVGFFVVHPCLAKCRPETEQMNIHIQSHTYCILHIDTHTMYMTM